MRSADVTLDEWTPDALPFLLAVLAGVAGVEAVRTHWDTVCLALIAAIYDALVLPLAIRTERGALTFRFLLRPKATARAGDVRVQTPAGWRRAAWPAVLVRSTGRSWWPAPAIVRTTWLKRAATEAGLVCEKSNSVGANQAAFPIGLFTVLLVAFAVFGAVLHPN